MNEGEWIETYELPREAAARPKILPAPTREPKLHIRLAAEDAAKVRALVNLGQAAVRRRTPWLAEEYEEVSTRYENALEKARAPRNVNF